MAQVKNRVFDYRNELVAKIRKAQEEIKTAGYPHRRDLGKHLKRMQAQLAQYDRFQSAARRGVA